MGLQYIRSTSEYILKLQLHQHSLLTRKVFSRHKFHHQSSSLDILIIYISKSSCLQVIFIFMPSSSGSRSSLDLDHHHWIILDLKHHWIILDLEHHWIILDLEHLWIVLDLGNHWIILDLEHHHQIQIITRSRSSSLDLDHHQIQIIITGSR